MPGEAVAAAAAALAAAEALAESCRAALEAAQRELAARQPQEAAALDIARRTASRLSRLEAEQAALEAVLAPARNIGGEARVLSALHVAAGFEAAVGAAFEDALSASLDSEADGAEQFWADLGAIDTPPALPEGARALAEMVSAPPALSRRLALAGWVEEPSPPAAGCSATSHLASGSSAATGAVALGRLHPAAGGTSGAAEHLRHREPAGRARRRNRRGGGRSPIGRGRRPPLQQRRGRRPATPSGSPACGWARQRGGWPVLARRRPS